MAGEQTQAYIAAQRKTGKSDIQIFNSMIDIPKFKAGIEQGNKLGHTNRQIAQGLGLNISSQPVDLDKVKKNEMLRQGKEAGKTKAWESGVLGATDLGAGVAQGILYAKDKVFGGDSYKKFTQERKEMDDWHNVRREANDQGFDVTRLAGQIASMPLPVGRGYQGARVLSKTGAKVAAQNAGFGTGLGGASFAKDSDARLAHASFGAVGGAVGGVVAKKVGDGVVRGYNAAKNNMRPGVKELVEEGEKHGVRTSVGDVGRNALVQKAEVQLENAPIIGMTGFRKAQQQEAKIAANKVVEKLQGKMSEANYKSLHKIQDAANNGDRNAARIFKIVENAKDDSSKILQAAAEVRAWREGNIASKLYDKVGDVAKAQGGSVQTTNTLSTLNSRIAQENGSLRPNKELLNELNDIQKRLNDPNVAKDFSNMRLLRSELGDLADSFAKGSNPNRPASKFLGDLRANVEKDISDYALNSGNNSLKNLYKSADSFYKNIMVTRDKAITKAMGSNTPDEIFNKFIQAGKGDKAANFYQNLDPKGQAALRYEMANRALDKATNSNTEAFSPAKFAGEFEKMHAPYQGVFKGADKAEMDGFVKLMRHVERSGQYLENPATGNRAAPYALTATVFASPGGAAAGGSTILLTKLLFTTATGRRILLSAKDLPPNSPKLANLLQMAEKLSVTTGSNLNKQ